MVACTAVLPAVTNVLPCGAVHFRRWMHPFVPSAAAAPHTSQATQQPRQRSRQTAAAGSRCSAARPATRCERCLWHGRCSSGRCPHPVRPANHHPRQVTRFPRYTSPAKLLETRRGRWGGGWHSAQRWVLPCMQLAAVNSCAERTLLHHPTPTPPQPPTPAPPGACALTPARTQVWRVGALLPADAACRGVRGPACV